jgi:hypothetical protein
MARVYPSAIIASTVMSRSGNYSSNHSAISEHVLGSVHSSWASYGWVVPRSARHRTMARRCSEYSAYLSQPSREPTSGLERLSCSSYE